jgi:hypothetical protein
MPNPTRYKIKRAGGRKQSSHKHSFPSAGSDALAPMIDRRDQHGSIEKELGDLGRCQNL